MSKRKILSFFSLIFLSFTFFGSIYTFAENKAVDSVKNSQEIVVSQKSNSESAKTNNIDKKIQSNIESKKNSDNDVKSTKNNIQNKYSAPVSKEALASAEKKAVEPEKKDNKKSENTKHYSDFEKVNGGAQVSAPEKKDENKAANSQFSPKLKKTPEEKKTEEKVKNEDTNFLEDLPEVEANDVSLPQVVAKEEENKATNTVLVIAAWSLIILGLAVIIFVILNGRKRKLQDLTSSDDTKGKGKSGKKKLLDEKYYK